MAVCGRIGEKMNEGTTDKMIGQGVLVVIETIWNVFALTWVAIAIYAGIVSDLPLFYISACMGILGAGIGLYIDIQYKKLEGEE